MEETDLEAIKRDIEDVHVYCEALQNKDLEKVPVNHPILIKYITFKEGVESLKKKCQTDGSKLIKLYKRRLKFDGQSYTSLNQIFKMLKAELLPEYSPGEYPFTSEEEWNRKRKDEKLSIQQIKDQDNRRRNIIDMKVQGSFPEALPTVETKSDTHLNLVIIGKTGVGKSATGNLIIGQINFFFENLQANSTTEAVNIGKGEFKGRTLHVLDTPGLFDTRTTEEVNKFRLAKCFTFDQLHEGVHAFILVLNSQAPRFTEEEQKVVKNIKKIFGLKVFQHCLLVLTHYDEYPSQSRPETKDFVSNLNNEAFKIFLENDLGGRFMFIDNHSETEYERDMYRNNIVAMVERMPDLYTNEMFKQAKDLWEEFQKKQSDATESVKVEKMSTFYLAVFGARKFIRGQLPQPNEAADAGLKKNIIDLMSKTEQIDIKIFDIVPGALEKMYDDTVDEENKEHKPGREIENKAKVKVRNNVDTTLLEKYISKLACTGKFEERDIDVGKVVEDVLESVDKRDRQRFIMDEIVKKQVKNVIYKPLMKECHEEINTVVDIGNTQIFDIAKDVITEHPIKESDIKKFQEKDEDLYKELIAKVLEKLKTHNIGDVIERFDEKELEKMIKLVLLERFDELKSIANKKFIKRSAGCFPTNSFVYKYRRKKCLISELKMGDKVLSVNASGKMVYEDIILLSHAEHDVMSVNVLITVNSRETICLSPQHLIHVEQLGNLLPAYKVRVGDNLFVHNGNSLKVVKVTEVSKHVESGMFCPNTTGGSIIVNDIVTSCYTDHFNHKVSHFFVSFINILYKILPSVVYQYFYGRDRLLNTPRFLDKIKHVVTNLQLLSFFEDCHK